MKKILIFSHAMELGGAERALLGLLETIDTTKYNVDLFLMRHQGELMKYIPDNINLLPENKKYSCLAIPLKKVVKRGEWSIALARIRGKFAAKRKIKLLGIEDNDIALEYSHKYTLNCMPQISNEEYDFAISFLTPHYYVAEKVKANRKIAWIHTDYSYIGVDKESQLKMWEKYDWIASISDNVTNSFLKIFPELQTKIKLIPNIMPMILLKSLENDFMVETEMPDDGAIRLLSIGRFCTAKNFDNVPFICKELINIGFNVKWYLIGYGNDEKLIRKKIEEADVQENVIILGKKENPYPYIRACDIYVQPSRYEGKCVSVIEAQILNKPVVITNYATAGSQLIDGYDGIIVPMDNIECAKGIAEVIKNRKLQCNLIENTKKNNYSNRDVIDLLYQIIENKYWKNLT